jgi:hypothetical protein
MNEAACRGSESCAKVFANRLATAYVQHFISHICHLTRPGRESSRTKVEPISDDCLLFSSSEILAVSGSFCAKGQPMGAIRERAAFDVNGLSSSLMALELPRFIGFKGKL